MADPPYVTCVEAKDIAEELIVKFPRVFAGFDVSRVQWIKTQDKKSKIPVKIHSVRYPVCVTTEMVFVVEVFEEVWQHLDKKRKRLAVFSRMVLVKEGGFDPESKNFRKLVSPPIRMTMEEFAVSGGVPDWLENDGARDPIEDISDEEIVRIPVTSGNIVGDEEDEEDEEPEEDEEDEDWDDEEDEEE